MNSRGLNTRTIGAAAFMMTTVTFGSATLLDREPSPPSVEVESVNPGATVERELCLRAAMGSAASAECGDLRISHALPTTTTYNKARTPVLSYSTHQAHPYPIVRADVTLPGNAEVPDSVTVALTLDGESSPRVKETWDGAEWSPGDTRRTVVGFDALDLSTGLHDYTLDVVNHYGPVEETTQVLNQELSIVNRKNSPFGAGWWLLGLEELHDVPGQSTKKLWVGGDGSTRVYTDQQNGFWTGVNRSRPDTIQEMGSEFHRLLPGKIKVVFNNNGKHIKTIPRISAQETLFGYGADELITITLPSPGAIRLYTFNYTSGDLTSVSAPSIGATTRTTTIGRSGDQIDSIQDPDNTTVSLQYDAGFTNRIVQRTDRMNVATDYTFNRLHQVSGSEVEGIPLAITHGETLSLDHRAPLPDTIETVIDGPRTDVADETRFVLNGFGAPEKITDALSGVTSLTRDDVDFPALVTQMSDPSGRTLTAVYNDRGNVTSTMDSGTGGVSTVEYTNANFPDFPTKVTQPEGEFVTFGYDGSGNRTTQTDKSNATVTFGYNADGQVTSVDGPVTPAASIGYDGNGNLDSTTSPGGITTTMILDDIGRVTEQRSPSTDGASGDIVATFTYNLQNQVLTQTTTGPSVMFNLINRNVGDSHASQILTVTNGYDAEGRLTSVATNPGSGGGSHAVTTDYDGLGRVTGGTTDGRPTTLVLDPAGNVTSQTTERGTITLVYDALGRMTSRTIPSKSFAQEICSLPDNCDNFTFPFYPNNGTGYLISGDTETFGYDAVGNVTSASNADASVSRTYDAASRVDSETVTVSGFGGASYTVGYAYDMNSRVTSVTYPDGEVVSYTYDVDTGRLDTVNGLDNVSYTYGFDDEGRITSLIYPGNLSETRSYDADSRLTQRVKGTLGTDNLTYDNLGKVVTARATLTGVDANNYYTGLGHLAATEDLEQFTFELFTLDAIGNVTRRQNTPIDVGEEQFEPIYDYGLEAGKVTTLDVQFDPGTGAPTPENPDPSGPFPDQTARNFDSAGDLKLEEQVKKFTDGTFFAGDPDREVVTSRMVMRHYYGVDGKLRAVQRMAQGGGTSENNLDNDGAFEEYFYDALGRRVMVRSRKDDNDLCDVFECLSYIEHTVWGIDGQALEERRWNGGGLSPSVSGSPPDNNSRLGKIAYTYGLGFDEPLGIVRNDTMLIVPHADYRGEFVTSTDQNGDEHGKNGVFRPGVDWPSQQRSAYLSKEGVLISSDSTWAGNVVQGFADQSGLLYKRNRYYDPVAGQFTQQDPIGLAGGLNLYGFAGGDPVNLSDPFGLMPCDDPEDPVCEEGLILTIGLNGSGAIAAGGNFEAGLAVNLDTEMAVFFVRGGGTAGVGVSGGAEISLEEGSLSSVIGLSGDMVEVEFGTPVQALGVNFTTSVREEPGLFGTGLKGFGLNVGPGVSLGPLINGTNAALISAPFSTKISPVATDFERCMGGIVGLGTGFFCR